MLLDPVEAFDAMVDGAGLKFAVFMALLVCFVGSFEELSIVFMVLVTSLIAFLAAKDLDLALARSSLTWRSTLVA
jgi:hypothetical protein